MRGVEGRSKGIWAMMGWGGGWVQDLKRGVVKGMWAASPSTVTSARPSAGRGASPKTNTNPSLCASPDESACACTTHKIPQIGFCAKERLDNLATAQIHFYAN